MPIEKIDLEADEWINGLLPKLRFEQDFYIYDGDSEPIIEDGKKVGISIKRGHIRLYSTGVVKLYRILVKGEQLPDEEYTEAEEEAFEKRYEEEFGKL